MAGIQRTGSQYVLTRNQSESGESVHGADQKASSSQPSVPLDSSRGSTHSSKSKKVSWTENRHMPRESSAKSSAESKPASLDASSSKSVKTDIPESQLEARKEIIKLALKEGTHIANIIENCQIRANDVDALNYLAKQACLVAWRKIVSGKDVKTVIRDLGCTVREDRNRNVFKLDSSISSMNRGLNNPDAMLTTEFYGGKVSCSSLIKGMINVLSKDMIDFLSKEGKANADDLIEKLGIEDKEIKIDLEYQMLKAAVELDDFKMNVPRRGAMEKPEEGWVVLVHKGDLSPGSKILNIRHIESIARYAVEQIDVEIKQGGNWGTVIETLADYVKNIQDKEKRYYLILSLLLKVRRSLSDELSKLVKEKEKMKFIKEKMKKAGGSLGVNDFKMIISSCSHIEKEVFKTFLEECGLLSTRSFSSLFFSKN